MNQSKERKIYYWYSASEVLSVTFIRWVKTKNNTGGKESNEIGVGVKVKSDWLYSQLFVKRVPKHLKRGENILRPYWPIYRTYKSARKHRNAIKRPLLETIHTKNYPS